MGSTQSSDIKRNQVAELTATSSSDAGSDDNANWIQIDNDSAEYLGENEDSGDEDDEQLKERLRILSETRSLCVLADFFMHPEKPVVVDPTASARCYFDRFSAEEQEVDEEEKTCILDDIKGLKQTAYNYRHPEVSVETTDPTICARCYFDRISAPQLEMIDEGAEGGKGLFLKELCLLRQAAHAYLHPEVPVSTTDPFSCGRNYFSRPSALKEATDEDEERNSILAEAKVMKYLVRDFRHPELSMVKAPAMCDRNFFNRASAPVQASLTEENERICILRDANTLKKLAVDFRHPELPIKSAAPFLFGRNYFERPSASVSIDAEEQDNILLELKLLKMWATFYQHPELPVEASDPASFGRNYYNRPSSWTDFDDYGDRERKAIAKDLQQLKALAADYMHPEIPVETSDPTVCGRNYFDRPAAFQTIPQKEILEAQQIWAEIGHLKQFATFYQHPELPIEAEPTAFARNYFNRPSAPGIDSFIRCLSEDSGEEVAEHDHYFHHAHFDMDDDIHLLHVDFDRNRAHHEEISTVRVATSGEGAVHDSSHDHKLSSSPGCVMTFAHLRHRHNVI